MTFRKNYKLRIKQSGRSQAWYARKMGVSKSILNRWLNGHDKMPLDRHIELDELTM